MTRLHRWYEIDTSKMEATKVEDIKNKLTIKSNIPIFGTDVYPDPVKVYEHRGNTLCVPKYFGFQNFGIPKKNDQIEGLSAPMKFEGTLLAELDQIEAYQKVMDALRRPTGTAYLSLPPGGGKTVVALKICADLGKKTIVIVNSEELMDQWVRRINTHIPGIKVGTMQGEKVEVDGCSIVICMIQSLTGRGYSEHLDKFGTVIFDEAHHMNAPTYSTFLSKLTCMYMLALSGTPHKANGGMHRVLESFIGPVTHMSQKKYTFPVLAKIVNLKYEPQKEHYMKNGDPNTSKMMTELTKIPERQDAIAKEIIDLYKDGHNTLVLCQRTEHAEILCCLFLQQYPEAKVFVFTGKTPKKERGHLESYRIIFSTYQMCGEAVDIAGLTALVLADPVMGLLMQAINRVIRGLNMTRSPQIVDFVDIYKKWRIYYYRRVRYYKKEEFKITRCGQNSSDKEEHETEGLLVSDEEQDDDRESPALKRLKREAPSSDSGLSTKRTRCAF